MNIRKKLMYPPYYYICNILITSATFNEAGDAANKVKKFIDSKLNEKEFIVLGPSVSSIVRLNNKYRFNIMIKYKKIDNLLPVMREVNNINIKNVSIDININI